MLRYELKDPELRTQLYELCGYAEFYRALQRAASLHLAERDAGGFIDVDVDVPIGSRTPPSYELKGKLHLRIPMSAVDAYDDQQTWYDMWDCLPAKSGFYMVEVNGNPNFGMGIYDAEKRAFTTVLGVPDKDPCGKVTRFAAIPDSSDEKSEAGTSTPSAGS